MIEIEYNSLKKLFFIRLDLKKIAWDEAQEYLSLFKKLYFKYEPANKHWEFKKDKYLQFVLEAKRNNIKYSLASEAQEIVDSDIKIKRETVFYRTEKFDNSILSEETQLFNYQKEVIDWSVQRSRLYNASEPGLGKSLMSICYIGHLFKTGKIDGCLLIIKNGLAYHWKRELLHFLNIFQEDDIEIIDNSNKDDIFNLTSKKILIVPNHLIANCFYFYKKDKKKKQKLSNLRWSNPYLDVKKTWNKSNLCLVIDEAHEIKNSESVRSSSIKAHVDFFDFRCFLSATPAINSFTDWFFQLNLLDSGILGMDEKTASLFVAAEMGTRFNPNEIVSFDVEKVDELKQKFNFNIIKKVKSELPEMKTIQIIEPVYFELTPKQQKLYKAVSDFYFLKKEEDSKGNISFKEVFMKFPYLIQVLDNPCLLNGKLENVDINSMLNSYKFEEDERFVWLEGFLHNKITVLKEKVILYDIHPLTLDLLEKHFAHYKPLKIHGQADLSQEDKQKIQDEFNFGDENKLILLSFMTSSSGINLQHGSSTIIMYTLPSDATLYRQALDRTYRINSTKDSVVKICVYDKTFDYIRYQRVLNRTELNDTFLSKNLSQEDLQRLFQGIK